MTLEGFEGKILLVDDDEMMRKLLTTEAEEAGVEFEVLEDADTTVERLDETVSAVFTDGLNGGWRKVIAAAREAKIPGFVVTGDERIEQAVSEAGATLLLKHKLEIGFVATALSQLTQPKDTPLPDERGFTPESDLLPGDVFEMNSYYDS